MSFDVGSNQKFTNKNEMMWCDTWQRLTLVIQNTLTIGIRYRDEEWGMYYSAKKICIFFMENKTLLGNNNNETDNVQCFAVKMLWVDIKFNCISVLMLI